MTESDSQRPGAELKAAREGMEVSTREVADALNLPTHVIEALEADDHDRLVPTVFTRGYLRSYARLLELDPDRLLAGYPEVTGEVDLVTGETSVTKASVGLPRQTIGLAAAIGATLLLIFLLVWLLAGNDDEGSQSGESQGAAVSLEQPEQPRAETVEPAGSSAGTDASGAELDPAQEARLEAQAESESPTTAGTANSGSGQREAEPEAVSAPAGEEPPTVAQTAPNSAEREATNTDTSTANPGAETRTAVASRRERRITEFGDDVVTMVFAEDCWVEVKSMDEVNLYSDLSRAGQTLVLTGRAPFRVRLGYAPGVTLSFNGETVPLRRHSRNNVANLVIGE